jgi:hypothetical protein
VYTKAQNGDTAQTLALIHDHIKIVSMIDDHMNPLIHRTDIGLRGDLSSSDEAYQRPRHKGSRLRMKGMGEFMLFGPLKTEGILRKFQKVIHFVQLTQNWKDFKNNSTT